MPDTRTNRQNFSDTISEIILSKQPKTSSLDEYLNKLGSNLNLYPSALEAYMAGSVFPNREILNDFGNHFELSISKVDGLAKASENQYKEFLSGKGPFERIKAKVLGSIRLDENFHHVVKRIKDADDTISFNMIADGLGADENHAFDLYHHLKDFRPLRKVDFYSSNAAEFLGDGEKNREQFVKDVFTQNRPTTSLDFEIKNFVKNGGTNFEELFKHLMNAWDTKYVGDIDSRLGIGHDTRIKLINEEGSTYAITRIAEENPNLSYQSQALLQWIAFGDKSYKKPIENGSGNIYLDSVRALQDEYQQKMQALPLDESKREKVKDEFFQNC